MQNLIRMLTAALLACGATGQLQAQHDHGAGGHVEDGEALGAVHFQPACDAEAASRFDRGLALMHHMMYQQARSLFKEVSRQDPDCAMAHWGVAASYLQPLWPERPDADILQRGREQISRARAVGAGDARELALIDAVGAFFQGDDTLAHRDRIESWAEAMAEAWQEHADDKDIAALYGLSLLSLAMAADTERRDALHDEAEAVLREVWEAENTHPGAIHYSIHATDVDGRARNALDMVEVYADIAPNVPHALHMPSHIYVRLGDWQQVIDWNRRSADAALDHHEAGPVSFHYIHALDYLVYGYLQQGDVDSAAEVAREAAEVDRHQPAFASAFHAATIPARLAVEQRDWAAARDLRVRSPDNLPWDDAHWPEALTWYARGLGAVHTGADDLADDAIARLRELGELAREAGETRFATYIEVDRSILRGWKHYANDEPEAATAEMQAAAELETTVEKDPITPGALYPPNEALGDLLLALGKPAEAVAAYEAAEAIWPGRYNTLKGLATATQQLAGR